MALEFIKLTLRWRN